MKELIRRYAPKSTLPVLKGAYSGVYSAIAFGLDRRRFLKHYARGFGADTQTNIEAQVIFSTHRIEKGLSHALFRDGFGKTVLKDLRYGLDRLEDHSSTVYQAALSAIKAYLEIHELRAFEIPEHRQILGEDLITEAKVCPSDMSGYAVIKRSSKVNNRKKSFKELFENRYTVREFSDEKVDLSRVREAIKISLKTPTVCNRQSFRIMIITSKSKIREALQVQNGFRGYDYPPVLALVLTDTRSFRGVAERNNLYIDGGSFMMSFLLGLEYVGLAACPLNTMFTIKEDSLTRKILSVSDNYNFIAYVAIGNFREENKVAKSFRFSADEVTVEVR